jgi:competence protein ComEC
MRVHQIHVGQGHTTLIEFEEGFRLLVDCDCWDVVVDPIERLTELIDPDPDGSRRIDLVILTHPHRDHVSGFGRLADEFELGEVWHSGHELDCEDDWYQDYLKALDRTGAVTGEASAEPLLVTDGGVEIRLFAPVEQVVSTDPGEVESRRHVHDQCMVVSVREESNSVLVAGDSRWVEWESRIVSEYAELLAHDLLIASHHGSRTFFMNDAEDDPYVDGLEAVSPRVVLVAVGENSHGHPHAEAMKEYERVANSVLRTDLLGTLIAESSDEGWVVEALGDTEGVPDDQPSEVYRDDDPQEVNSAGGLAGAAALGVGVALATGAIRRRKDRAARRRPEPAHWGI